MQRTAWEAQTRHQETGLVGLQLATKGLAVLSLPRALSPAHSPVQLIMGDLPAPCTSTLYSTRPGSILTVTHTSHPPQYLNMKDIWKGAALTRVLIKKTIC